MAGRSIYNTADRRLRRRWLQRREHDGPPGNCNGDDLRRTDYRHTRSECDVDLVYVLVTGVRLIVPVVSPINVIFLLSRYFGGSEGGH